MDAYVTQPQHLDHLAPVWTALPPARRGRLFVGFGAEMAAYAVTLGLEPYAGAPPQQQEPVLVASGNELPGIRSAILLEHGVGQTYQGVDHTSWPGGVGREQVVLFVCPNQRVARANAERYPTVPTEVVGSPFVEALRRLPPYPLDVPRVALSTHWESGLCSETRGAWAHMESAYEAACRARPDAFVLHGHPRHQDFTAWKAREWGVEFEPSFAMLTRRAWVYVTDNSSTLYEWAALGRPVVVVSAPWYRREVEHGLRFWALADVGVQVSEPDEFDAALIVALADPSPQRQRRAAICSYLFGADLSRGAAQRAADAIERALA